MLRVQAKQNLQRYAQCEKSIAWPFVIPSYGCPVNTICICNGWRRVTSLHIARVVVTVGIRIHVRAHQGILSRDVMVP